MKEVKMSYPAFKKEHVELVRTLKSKNPKKIKEELNEQGEELIKESKKRKKTLPKDIYKEI